MKHMHSNQAGAREIKIRRSSNGNRDHHGQGVPFTKVDNHKKAPYKMQADSLNVHDFSKSKPITLKHIAMLPDGGQGFGSMFFETHVMF